MWEKTQKNGFDPWREGGMARERIRRDKKKSWGRANRERRRRAYFYAQGYAQGNPICQLLGDEELEWETIGEWFFWFFQKTRMEKRNRVLLEMFLLALVIGIDI